MAKQKSTTAPAIDLGISLDELREQVIERATERLIEQFDASSYNRIAQVVSDAAKKAVVKYGDDVILPIVREKIETLAMQPTNKWGEPSDKGQTFREFMVQQCENYLTEPVNYEGKPKLDANGYSWSQSSTRIVHMVHEHFQYNINFALQAAVKDVNAKLAQGIQETVKVKLGEIVAGLKCEVKTK